MQVYTPEQAAQLLQVRESWLRKKAAARVIPCTFIGKHLRFTANDIDSIVAAGATLPTGRRPRRRSATARRGDDLPSPRQRSVHAHRDDPESDGRR